MLEQNSLYNSFDFNVAMSHANNTAAVTTVIPDFICPSDPQSSEPILSGRKEGGGSNPTACLGLWYPVSIGPTAPDFCAFGLDTTPSSTNPTCKHCNFGTENGGFCKGSGLKGTKCYSGLFGRSIYGLRLSLVRDGLSKTLMNGETLPSHSSYNGAFCHNFPVASTQIPLNLMETDTGYSRVSGFKSAHPTGAQFSFGDGSVTMLSSEIDYVLWNRLGDREDGKSVSIP